MMYYTFDITIIRKKLTMTERRELIVTMRRVISKMWRVGDPNSHKRGMKIQRHTTQCLPLV